MKRLLFLLLCPLLSFAQQIHSHNDYVKAEPFWGAYNARAASIEADVFLVDGKLLVAHTKEELAKAPTLDSLYLKPIARLFDQHKNKVSPDRKYMFQLVIDVKDDGVETLKKIQEAIAPYRTCFDRALNPMAIQLIISGNRPAVAAWVDYPAYLQFDGRPNEVYDSETLKHVGLISDSFHNYSRWKGEGELTDRDRETLKRIIKRAHGQSKPIRFWATPDTPTAWKQLTRLDVDFINTDRVKECAETLK
ncbi:phosphatidylinositol-specific phospholipase C/glycerophosphodiester phosphodiesterase family protein [Tellurirhabdus bombi]|uniref:phosphatidylinositol-specific phospholipase C/glycerophosphodiester phosphodiesterase family protein n=1 Tax=Tellurirhabdus bombi TaxID=2907205 RepID=UPI001F24E691|nr:phosphatidylinositol-specific phospholipase C/glycerophosphodiester phosphodiesterase family protein [Tellurirhabdus bombi]